MNRLNENERSTVIDLIFEMNHYLAGIDLKIKKLGGESTLRSGQRNRKFPDVLLFADLNKTSVLQSWEIKMPDVPISDSVFRNDAENKAKLMRLNSFFIWNYSYGELYVEENDQFIRKKVWSLPQIKNRIDVITYQSDWIDLLKNIIIEINGYLESGSIRNVSTEKLLLEDIPLSLILEHKLRLGSFIRSAADRDIILRSFFSHWWDNVKVEFQFDEQNEYDAFSKVLILKWINRFLFAHIIKSRFSPARVIDSVSYDTTADEIMSMFNQITNQIDFYSIFSIDENEKLLSPEFLLDLISFSMLLSESDGIILDQSLFQQLMEKTISLGKREIGGQFATPQNLAKFLVKITINNLEDHTIDPCAGTGTIVKEILSAKQSANNNAYDTLWCSDKYSFPLQMAHMSLIKDLDDRIPIKIFQHNVFDLSIGENIEIVNPADGQLLNFEIPIFDSIISNLPFVSFEIISEDEKNKIKEIVEHVYTDSHVRLSMKSDLFTFIVFKLHEIIKDTGRIGIIVSNSWLGTKWGNSFYKALIHFLNLENVIISSSGRWFKNAKVVTTILLLTKKLPAQSTAITAFNLLYKSIEEITESEDTFVRVTSSIILKNNNIDSVVSNSLYSSEDIIKISSLGVSFNTLFHNVMWLDEIRANLIKIITKFDIARGSRRGWNDMFYPEDPENASEPIYLVPTLKNPRHLISLVAETDILAFCCNVSLEELDEKEHLKAKKWIIDFSSKTNGTGIPLPEVLKKNESTYWYSMQDSEKAVMVTILNPNKRLFISKFPQPTFIDQRFISINPKQAMSEVELNISHALLNSVIGLFYIEAVGFGRGEGVLDINSKSFSEINILNSDLLTIQQKEAIIESFSVLLLREPLDLENELVSTDRIAFDSIVLEAFGILDKYDVIKRSLLSMYNARLSVIV